jgi:integrase/recombinase XerD
MFCAYLTHPSYGWSEFCQRMFGDVPAQICFEWNTPRHTTDDAVPPSRRAFTKPELQRLFDYLDDLIDREYAAGSKRWLPSLRDSIAFKVCYAYGLRRREVVKGQFDFPVGGQLISLLADRLCPCPRSVDLLLI